eukprot:1610521-Rhodomonas_salina.1
MPHSQAINDRRTAGRTVPSSRVSDRNLDYLFGGEPDHQKHDSPTHTTPDRPGQDNMGRDTL